MTYVVVAPRELTDLVYRCARTAGVPVRIARVLASQWTAAAILVAESDAEHSARHGLPVEQQAFDCLCRSADAFLVSEALLDEIAES